MLSLELIEHFMSRRHRRQLWSKYGWTQQEQQEASCECWKLGGSSAKIIGILKWRPLKHTQHPFETDQQAWEWVGERADAGSALHIKAIAICIRSQMEAEHGVERRNQS